MKFLDSFKKSVTAAMFFTSFISVFIVGSILISGEIRKFSSERKSLSANYITQQKEKARDEVSRAIEYIEFRKQHTRNELETSLKERVYEAYVVAEGIYNRFKGKRSRNEIINLIKEALRPVRFNNGRGYFYIYDMKGNNILLPTSPELEGTNLIDLQDSRGLYTIQRAIKLVSSSGEGFMEWHWFKPGDSGGMMKKIGFLKSFPPYNLFIGTGEYIEDFTEDIKNETLGWINKIRFNKDGYIFVIDYLGKVLAHRDRDIINNNLLDYRDADRKFIFREMIRLSRKEQGDFLEYRLISYITNERPGNKIAFIKNVNDWQWTVGTGVYVDEIDKIINLKQKELIGNISRDIAIIIFVLIITLILIFRFSKFTAGSITMNINRFNEFFKQSAVKSVKIDTENIKFKEFRNLAESANMMTDERNRAEEALRQIQEQLLRSRKMEALGLLAGGVAHDLNNVLSAVIGYPELILETMAEDDPHRKYIQTILTSGNKAAAIVEDLLALARRGVQQSVLLDINRIISQYLISPEHVNTMSSHPDVSIETFLEPDLMKIRGSEIHIQKSVMNLVNNAAEALPDGGRIILKTENYYADKPITGYQQLDEGDYVLLSIKDNGQGISNDDLEHIFEPFFSKKVMGRSGTGLGMAVVWGTIQDHNGAINVQTRENWGTEFQLYFPAAREALEESTVPHERESYSGNGEYILIVDDIREQRELSCEILKSLGYNAFSVKDADEAVEFVRNNRTDLVILDMILEDPDVDGLETYRKILEVKHDQKAVIASGYAENDRVRETMKLGAGQFIKKPYTIEKIGIAVKKELYS